MTPIRPTPEQRAEMAEYIEKTSPGLLDDLGIDAVAHRLSGDGHRHHRNCVHNLTPEDQVALHGYTIEKWLAVIGPLPQQITPDEWREVTDA